MGRVVSQALLGGPTLPDVCRDQRRPTSSLCVLPGTHWALSPHVCGAEGRSAAKHAQAWSSPAVSQMPNFRMAAGHLPVPVSHL